MKGKLTYQVKVEGWAKAAIAVATTTNGSMEDKTWDQSLLPTSFESIPKESNEKFPSLLWNPTLPMIGEVEQANVDKAPLRQPFGSFENEEEEEEGKERD